MEIAYLFWAIADGIVLAAGMIPLALLGSAVIGIIMLMFMNRKSLCNPYIAVISCDNREAGERAGDDTDFISDLSDMEGIASAVLVSYNGDYLQ